MSTAIDVPESSNAAKEKPAIVAPPPPPRPAGWKKGVAIMDFILRLGAIASVLGGAATMANADQSLSLFNQFSQFEASYDSFSAFEFFLVVMSLTGGYLVLSLPFSVVTIVRPNAVGARLLLIILDTEDTIKAIFSLLWLDHVVFLTLATSGAAAAASMVYLAHNGNGDANWFAICNQFGDFCLTTSSAVVASLVGVVLMVFLIIMSAFSLRSH